jgi:aspartate-semialdehyde dehydrogenase
VSDRPLKLALVGATGAVGRAVLEDLEAREVRVAEIRLFASERSRDELVEFRGDELEVEVLSDRSFRGCDAAILAAGQDVARRWAPSAWAEGCPAVDVSGAFRDDLAVPLVVAEVNPEALAGVEARGIVASPGAASVALAIALSPIQRAAGLSRLVVTELHAASGAGRAGVRQLEREVTALLGGEEPDPSDLSHRMGFNLVPQVGPFGTDGRTSEEARLEPELRRILGVPGLRVSATAVRVPVFYAHGLVVNVTTERPLSAEAARALLRAAPALKVVDAPGDRIYPMPMLAVNDDAVLVGRIRDDPSSPNALDLLAVADNLRRGAAGNAVRIAEALARRAGARSSRRPPRPWERA